MPLINEPIGRPHGQALTAPERISLDELIALGYRPEPPLLSYPYPDALDTHPAAMAWIVGAFVLGVIAALLGVVLAFVL